MYALEGFVRAFIEFIGEFCLDMVNTFANGGR